MRLLLTQTFTVPVLPKWDRSNRCSSTVRSRSTLDGVSGSGSAFDDGLVSTGPGGDVAFLNRGGHQIGKKIGSAGEGWSTEFGHLGAHALDDKVVVPANSQRLYDALQAQKIPSRYLELASGGHGLNGYKGPMWDAWQQQSLAWLRELKLVSATEME